MYHLQPLMFLGLFPLFLYYEGWFRDHVCQPLLLFVFCCHSLLLMLILAEFQWCSRTLSPEHFRDPTILNCLCDWLNYTSSVFDGSEFRVRGDIWIQPSSLLIKNGVCVCLLVGLSLCTSDKLFRASELAPLLYSLSTLTVGGTLAFGLGFSEFLLVSRTSSLTLSIAGIFKVDLWMEPLSVVFGWKGCSQNWEDFYNLII